MPSIHLGQIIWKICVCHIIILDFAMVAGFVVVKWLPLCVSNLPHLEEDCVVCVTSAVPCFLLTQIVLMRVFHSKIDLESNNVC